MKVTILLSTYNGAGHLRALLDSLLAQSLTDWRLLVRDDGSTDETLEVLGEYREREPEKISFLPGEGNLGACGSFSRLLEAATGDYFMFCDQDDVWLPEKIAVTARKMTEMEGWYGRETPLLVHTDLQVTDAELKPIAPSLWRYQDSDPEGGVAVNRLLVQNCVTGCTVMINAPLRQLALPVAPEAMMHDWWLALVAAAFGDIGCVAEPTVRYRQHGTNDTGAWSGTVAALGQRRAGRRPAPATPSREGQAAAFLDRYGARLPAAVRDTVAAYVHLRDADFLGRRYLILKYRFYYSGLARNIANLVAGWG